jgi:hypothetical protein
MGRPVIQIVSTLKSSLPLRPGRPQGSPLLYNGFFLAPEEVAIYLIIYLARPV